MQKFQLLLLCLCCSVFSLNAQTGVDTVLYEGFETDPTGNWLPYPNGADTSWVNFDADGLTPITGDPLDAQWFWTDEFRHSIDSVTGDTNFVLASLSYLQGFAPGNRNWLILPPIQVTNNTYTLSWRSAPWQLPRYLDGYSVLVSTTTNDAASDPNPFTDLLFRAASMDEIVGESESVSMENFTFTPGYIHANGLTDSAYFEPFSSPTDTTLYAGLLEPHSASLAAYAGQTIYIAFLHDSDDDNYLEIDDILITSAEASGTTAASAPDLRFRTYPNPADHRMTVSYRLPQAGQVGLRIVDVTGKVLADVPAKQQAAGEYAIDLAVRGLAPGAYTLVLTVDGTVVSKVFTKR